MIEDLVVLVADKDIEQSLRGLFDRPPALKISPIRPEILTHPNRDSGRYHTGHEILAAYASHSKHGLIVFDRAWEGAPSKDRRVLEQDVEAKLSAAWSDRARCIVIEPEVENWVWSDSPNIDVALGWQGREPKLRTWLGQQNLWPTGQSKPPDPKKAFEKALREVNLPPSSSVFRKIADTVSFTRCKDESFREVVSTLRKWFPPKRPE
ncbi:MAG: hypothetical protein HYR85_03165 [Planctomycetes bacterium]|nr:hypothetical protein [Planctomycetota bacterium]MBI3848224.1 hypothetical protein [Planctomycetota bacterium]